MNDKRWWVSWYHRTNLGPFELPTPWWVSGGGNHRKTICAAIVATDEDAARKCVYAAYDTRPDHLAFRFVESRPDDWAPWKMAPGVQGESRFPRAEWMQWDTP